MLSYPKRFIDGTFKIVPRSYRQLLIIIIYHTQLKCYLPACFILMSHKSKAAYEYAFRNLFLICRNLDIKLNPEFIMCDFEAALRKGIIEIFPKAQIVGCYFHYCKALWSYMSHNSLTTKERLNDSIKLMVFLKILAHIEISERKSLFQGIKDLFEKKDKGYKEMLAYYQKNWLDSYFVEPMDIGEGEEDALLIARTNNICEFYNHYLNNKIGVTFPRLAILVDHLLDEELNIREYIMKATVDMTLEPHLPRGFVVKEDELPIGSLSKLLQEKKNQKYDLRSTFQEKQFLAACTVLVEKCYQVMLVTNSDNQDVYNDQLAIEEAEIQEERKNEVANGNLFII